MSVSPGKLPLVRCMVVNYRTAELTIDCLSSLADLQKSWPALEAVVVDNASPDDSCRLLASAIEANGWQGWVRFIPESSNGGFAHGNNVAFNAETGSKPDFYWLLNPDTVVRPGALAPLVDAMTRNPRIGIVGSRLEWPDGTQQHSTFRFPTAIRELFSCLPLGMLAPRFSDWMIAIPPEPVSGPRDWVSGASMLMRPEVLRDVGLMDAKYFLYYEETDYCLNASRKGWQSWFEAESRVVHLVGRSTGVTGRDNRLSRRPAYWFQSRSHYFIKNHGRLSAVAADLALAAGTILTRLGDSVRRRTSSVPQHFLTDLLSHGTIGSGLWRAPHRSK